MSTWTSKIAIVALLSGCATSIPAPDRADLRIEGQVVSIVAPAGFCVDPQSVDVTKAGGFVLFSDCALTGAAGGTVSTAVISASVAPTGLNGTLVELQKFLTTEPGKITLGRSGDMQAITVVESRVVDDVLLIKVDDRGAQPIRGVSPEIWRGFFVAGGRAVTATVSGAAEGGTSDIHARRYLGQLAASTRAANKT